MASSMINDELLGSGDSQVRIIILKDRISEVSSIS
jgi:hypothetical protein